MNSVDSRRIVYFSMEIALESSMPTYAGGLGVLAGDALRSAADLGVPITALSLVHHKGYFRQVLDSMGHQTEIPDAWNPATKLERLSVTVSVPVGQRSVQVGVWRYLIHGVEGHIVPVLLLDTRLPENSADDAALTDSLYLGDDRHRLKQEIILGMGGLAVLRALGYQDVQSYHMNEGHAALLTLALLEEVLHQAGHGELAPEDIEAVRRRCVFTTHTPVPAGHDHFGRELVIELLGAHRAQILEKLACCLNGQLNMTYLALRFSHYVNGVAMHHGQISRGMFPDYPIHAITNGVHAVAWASEPFQKLYDRHVPEWRHDNLYLRYAVGIALGEIGEAHLQAKQELMRVLKERTGTQLDPKIMTIGFARRATGYKRPGLLFSDLERLQWIARQVGPLQIVFGGKAHPRDQSGKDAIYGIFEAARQLQGSIPVIYVENYDLAWARLLTSGVDLWLNTPQHPQEASGTSGMKAALNGVPSLSVMDGWWVEGCIEGVTGWAIGDDEASGGPTEELTSLYGKLEWMILPMYYGRPAAYARVMRSAIALNASFFNTQRMMEQYLANAYLPASAEAATVRPAARAGT